MLMKRMMMTLCSLLITGFSVAQSTSPTRVENNAETFEVLESLISTNYQESAFGDVLEELKSETGLALRLDESAKDNNLDEDTLITVQYESMRLATVLQFMLESYQCTWTVRDGVVTILSEDAALDQLSLTVLDCSDVLAGIQPREITHLLSGHQRAPGGSGLIGGVFSLLPQDPVVEVEDAETEPEKKEVPKAQTIVQTISPQEQLMEILVETVDPDSWEMNGGNGRIRYLNNMFIIRQTGENIREVNLLLEHLRTGGISR